MHGTIVCGVTDAAGGRAAAQLGAALAARLELRLVLVYVAAAGRPDGRTGTTGGKRVVTAIAREIGDDVELRIVHGDRVEGIARVAAEEGADAVVIGSRQRGARGRLLRCTLAQELEAATRVPVLVAPPQTRERSGCRLEVAGPRAGR